MKVDILNNKASKYGLNVRLVNEKDARTILQLRTNSVLSRHIHKTENDLEKQIIYINDYKSREQKGTEYYFAFSLIGNPDPIGFYRIHNIDLLKSSFSIGSWIFEQDITENIPIIADILSREFGFELLNLRTCFFDVRINNKKVYNYHMLFSPIFIMEDEEENNFFYLKKETFEINKEKILKYLI